MGKFPRRRSPQDRAFDLLEVDDHSVMGESWTARRKRLALIGALTPPGPPRTMPAIACTLEGG
jgi:hypothetical protein